MNKFLEIIKNTDRKPIFCDLNNLLYRSYYVFGPDRFVSRKGNYNGHLFGLVQNIRTMDILGYEIFLCEDSKCEWRQQLNEEYKSQRESKQFYLYYPKIRDLISDLSHVHSLSAEGYEADDVMYSAAKICSQNNIDCYVFTTDKDLLQSLDEHVTIVHKVTLKENEEVKFNSQEYMEKFPVEPNKLAIFRAFKGDNSDNLPPPVVRLPKDLILDLVDYLYENSNLAGYKIKKKSHEKWVKLLVENWQKYLTNYNMMKLNIINFNVLEKSSVGSFEKICDDYDLIQYEQYVKSQHNI